MGSRKERKLIDTLLVLYSTVQYLEPVGLCHSRHSRHSCVPTGTPEIQARDPAQDPLIRRYHSLSLPGCLSCLDTRTKAESKTPQPAVPVTNYRLRATSQDSAESAVKSRETFYYLFYCATCIHLHFWCVRYIVCGVSCVQTSLQSRNC
jgi:hypothetical protein